MEKRLKSDELELSRLENIPKTSKALKHFALPSTNVKEKIAFAQTLELQEALKSSHYVINHGQANNLIVINITAKKTLELFEQKKHQHFEVLRHVACLNKIPEYRDVKWYKKNYIREFRYYSSEDMPIRAELISGDVYLGYCNTSMSAFGSFSNGKRSDLYRAQATIEENIYHYFPDREFSKEVSKKLISLTKEEEGGTLYSICVPKASFDEIGYLSFPSGAPVSMKDFLRIYHHLPKPLKKRILSKQMDSWQDGGNPSRFAWQPLQVRLLSSKLSQEAGVFILPHTTLPEKKVIELEDKIEKYLLTLPKDWENFLWRKRTLKSLYDFFDFRTYKKFYETITRI